MEKLKQHPIVKKAGFNRIVLCGVLALMYLLFSLANKNFAGLPRILSALNYAYFLGFLSLGVTFVIATGGIDFSIGPVMFCAALISGFCLTSYGVPMGISLVLSVLVGMLFGVFNGYLVAYCSVPPFIVSMASMNIAKGLASVFTKTQTVSWPQSSAPGGWYRNLIKMGSIPVGLIIFLAFAALCAVILNQTRAGRYILCLGSNQEAVRLSGVNVKKWKMLAYVICGTLVGIAAIFFVAAYTSSPATATSTTTRQSQGASWAEPLWPAAWPLSAAPSSACSSSLCCRRAFWPWAPPRTISRSLPASSLLPPSMRTWWRDAGRIKYTGRVKEWAK